MITMELPPVGSKANPEPAYPVLATHGGSFNVAILTGEGKGCWISGPLIGKEFDNSSFNWDIWPQGRSVILTQEKAWV